MKKNRKDAIKDQEEVIAAAQQNLQKEVDKLAEINTLKEISIPELFALLGTIPDVTKGINLEFMEIQVIPGEKFKPVPDGKPPIKTESGTICEVFYDYYFTDQHKDIIKLFVTSQTYVEKFYWNL